VLFLVPLAYLLGSFPTAALVARATGHDILREGSGNPGASNVYRLAGWKAGLIAFMGDFAKGAIPSAVGLVLDGHRALYSAKGLEWSPPIAYRWLRYEDPMPVQRLAEGTKKLRRRGARFDPEAVEKACANGAQTGFLI